MSIDEAAARVSSIMALVGEEDYEAAASKESDFNAAILLAVVAGDPNAVALARFGLFIHTLQFPRW